ncbi:MAG: translation initiation factor [Pirellulaceae bacterium]
MRLFEGTPFDRPPTCDRCGQLESECKCPPPPKEWLSPDKQTANLRIEKRKKGKVVTVIRGLSANDNDLPELLTHLKNKCGAGGSIDGDQIELQGEHLERIRAALSDKGYRVQ